MVTTVKAIWDIIVPVLITHLHRSSRTSENKIKTQLTTRPVKEKEQDGREAAEPECSAPSSTRWKRTAEGRSGKPRPNTRRLRRSASRIALEAARFGRTRARVPVALPETSIWARIDQHFCSVHAPDPVVRDGERGRRLRRVQCR
jgi:hypothetical protein